MKPEVELLEAIEERIASEGEAALTQPERFYRALYHLEGEVNNGAFHQYFANAPADWPFEALDALRAVGAAQMAALLDAAIDRFPGRVIPEDTQARWQALEALSEAQLATLDDLSNQFTDYPDDLRALIDAYAQAHEAEFRGPRTLLEMWHSKRRRGADTTPRVITRKIDFEKEAEADRPYSSRLCPECGYPSPDYRISCKRCGYPHGRVAS